MVRMIKVHILDRNGMEIKDVNLQKAERIFKETYADALEGFICDKRTEEVICELGPAAEELFVVDQILGRG